MKSAAYIQTPFQTNFSMKGAVLSESLLFAIKVISMEADLGCTTKGQMIKTS